MTTKISKRQKTQYNHFCKVRTSLYDLFRRTKTFQLNFDEFLELRKELYLEHPSMGKRRNGENKLNQYYRGCLNGIESTLFNILQTEQVEWLHCYESQFNRPKYVKQWEQIPLSIRMNEGLVKSNHFWKNPSDPLNPKPWGTKTEIF